MSIQNQNSYQQAQALQELINEITSNQNAQNTTFAIYRVTSISNDGKLSLKLDGTTDRITGITNQTPYNFSINDQALVIFKDGSRNNCYVCAKIQPQSKDLITYGLEEKIKNVETQVINLSNVFAQKGSNSNGSDGINGKNGSNGADGVDGNRWHVGNGRPGTHTLEKMLQLAEQELGYYGKATNSNLDDKTANKGYLPPPGAMYTKYARDLGQSIYGQTSLSPYYNKQGVSWNSTFVDWLLWKLSNEDQTTMERLKPQNAIKYTIESIKSGYASQNKYSTTTPRVGDQIIFDEVEDNYVATGLVVEVTSTNVITIEGSIPEYQSGTTFDNTVRIVQRRSTPIAGGSGTGGRSYIINGYGQIDYEFEVDNPGEGDYYLDALSGKIWKYDDHDWQDTGMILAGGGSGTTDFEQLINRPSYNGSLMNRFTNIPEVKTASWDAKSTVSGTVNGNNWETITVNGTTHNIPQGGGITEANEPLFVLNNSVFMAYGNGLYVDSSQTSPKPLEIQVYGDSLICNSNGLSVNTSVIATVSDLNTGLATKQDLLTFTAPIINTNNNVGLNIGDGLKVNLLNNKLSVKVDNNNVVIAGGNIALSTNASNAIEDVLENSSIWSAKQDAISDLSDIRTGAGLGATALQPSALDAYSTTAQMNAAISSHHDSTKQDMLSAGSGITINSNTVSVKVDNNNVVIAGGNIALSTNASNAIEDVLENSSIWSAKQNALSAGGGIQISSDTIGVKIGDGLIIDVDRSIKIYNGTGIKIGNNGETEVDTAVIATVSALNNGLATKSTVSGTNDGTNWTSLTVNGSTYAIPQGGGSSYTAGSGITINTDNVISAKVDNNYVIIDSAGNIALGVNATNAIEEVIENASTWDAKSTVSGTTDSTGTYWRTITVNGTQKEIPMGGAGTNKFAHNILVKYEGPDGNDLYSFVLLTPQSTQYTTWQQINYALEHYVSNSAGTIMSGGGVNAYGYYYDENEQTSYSVIRICFDGFTEFLELDSETVPTQLVHSGSTIYDTIVGIV